MDTIHLILVFLLVSPLATQARECPPIPGVWKALFDKEEFSIFSELVQASFECPPAIEDTISIFAVPDSVLSQIPASDPIFTNAEFRTQVLSTHVVSSGQLVWKEYETLAKCQGVRILSAGGHMGGLGLSGTYTFGVSPSVLNGARVTKKSVLTVDGNIVHEIDSLLEPQGENDQSPPTTDGGHHEVKDLTAFGALVEGKPDALYCPATGSVVPSCSCCPSAPLPKGNMCNSQEVGITFELSSSTLTGCDLSTVPKQAVLAAWSVALNIPVTDLELKIVSCEVRSDGSGKQHALADSEWFLVALTGKRGTNTVNFRRKVAATLEDSNASWRQNLVSTFQLLSYGYSTEMLVNLGLFPDDKVLCAADFSIRSSCDACPSYEGDVSAAVGLATPQQLCRASTE